MSLIVIFVVIDYITNLKLFETATFRDIVLYYWYYLAWFIGIIAPIGILLASMFAMSSMAKHSELTALKAAGMGPTSRKMPNYKKEFDARSWIRAGEKVGIPTLIIHGTADEDVEVGLRTNTTR
jgi:pimeloyl-ACP methyl ester carboxylesterase